MGKIVGAITGANAAERAASRGQREATRLQTEMFDKNMAFQEEQWDWQKQQAQPWMKAGLGALEQYQGKINTGFNFDPASDPVYQQRLLEQSKAFGAGGASKGMQLSGASLKGLRDITGAELGSSYGRQFDKYQADLSNMGNLMNIGMGASTNLSNVGGQYASNVGNMMTNQGAGLAQGAQNLGDIKAAGATAGFNSLMSMGNMAAGVMSGYGAMMPKQGVK